MPPAFASPTASKKSLIPVSVTLTTEKARNRPELGTAPDYRALKLPSDFLYPRYWPVWAALGLLRFGVFLPLALARWLGALWGWVFLLLNRKRRRIVRANLSMCFPELAKRERERLLRRHFVVIGKSYADLGFLAWASKPWLEQHIRIVGREHLQIHRDKNVILLTPHCLGVNFGSIVARHREAFSMFKPLHDDVANWFLNKGRMRFGVRLLSRIQGLRPVVRALRLGALFYYVPDEDFGPGQSVFAPFFGIASATLPTVGRLAEMTDAVVIPVLAKMLPGGQGHEVVFKPALTSFPTGDRLKDAARMNEALEEVIRMAPEQYMWTLKLFRTRPDDGSSPYD
ncbi:MAG: lipid A biosynthesis acyltransferase [Acidiferrobacterales bacterium]